MVRSICTNTCEKAVVLVKPHKQFVNPLTAARELRLAMVLQAWMGAARTSAPTHDISNPSTHPLLVHCLQSSWARLLLFLQWTAQDKAN